MSSTTSYVITRSPTSAPTSEPTVEAIEDAASAASTDAMLIGILFGGAVFLLIAGAAFHYRIVKKRKGKYMSATEELGTGLNVESFLSQHLAIGSNNNPEWSGLSIDQGDERPLSPAGSSCASSRSLSHGDVEMQEVKHVVSLDESVPIFSLPSPSDHDADADTDADAGGAGGTGGAAEKELLQGLPPPLASDGGLILSNVAGAQTHSL